MNVNEYVIAPLLGNTSVIGLFLIPLITMRLFAEEKRTGTIELLLTSPISDWEIILGKWLGAMVHVSVRARHVRDQHRAALRLGTAGLASDPGRLSRPDPAGRHAAGHRTFISTTTRNQIIAGGATFAVCLLLWVLSWFSYYNDAGWAQAVAYCSILTHFESFSKA